MLQLSDVAFGFPQRPRFLGPVSLRMQPGEFWAIVGPNGAGKSTLMRLMAGLYAAHGGSVLLDGRPLATWSRRARAQRIAMVPQRPTDDLDLTVREIVLMGRFPHRSFGLFDSAADHQFANQAMTRTTTIEFADRPLATLSGGEAQRAHIAAALAQEPKLLLLDEPTASLDLQHERAIFGLLRRQAREDGLTLAVVTHDLNLAADFCSHVLLLHDGKPVACGSPADVLTPENLAPVYGVQLSSLAVPGGENRRWLVPTLTPTSSERRP